MKKIEVHRKVVAEEKIISVLTEDQFQAVMGLPKDKMANRLFDFEQTYCSTVIIKGEPVHRVIDKTSGKPTVIYDAPHNPKQSSL